MFFIFRKIFADRVLFFKMLVASLFVNLLALATPIYVIQVLQRYIAYGVISTLITLFIGIIFIVIFEFFFKNIRHRMARQYELGNVTYANQVLNKLVSIKTQIYEVSKKFRNDIINHHLSNIQIRKGQIDMTNLFIEDLIQNETNAWQEFEAWVGSPLEVETYKFEPLKPQLGEWANLDSKLTLFSSNLATLSNRLGYVNV